MRPFWETGKVTHRFIDMPDTPSDILYSPWIDLKPTGTVLVTKQKWFGWGTE